MANIYVPKNRGATEHRGAIDRVVFCDPAQPFVIILLTDGATVLGDADADQFARGTTYRFLGRWQDDEKRGLRFRFSTFVVHSAHGKAGVVKYLTDSCDGIGVKMAERIYAKFGGAAVETLRADPAKVAAECKLEIGLCEIAAIQLESNARFEDTRIDLFTLFAGRGFQGKLIDRSIAKWGVRAPTVIKKNPFALLGMPSAGFKRCDKLWSDLGLQKDALKRSGLCAWNIIRNEGQGHTWVAAADVAAKLREAIPTCDVKRALRFAIRARKLKKRVDEAGQCWLAVYRRATSEERIAAALARLTDGPVLWPTERVPVSREDGDQLPSAHQVEELKKATAAPVGMLLGGPGTGKTHSLAYLLREVIEEFGIENVKVCCPTGKAAVRASQALKLAGLDLQAITIHSTLGIGRNGHDGDGWEFAYNARNPLPYQFLIVDETSMVDADLMADTLDALVAPRVIPGRPAVPERVYGAGEMVPPRCRRCNRELTNPASWEIGYGPECAKHVSPEFYEAVEPEEATGTVVLPAVPEQPEIRLPGTHVLFVGDPHQLPPVGHGAPLRDMIKGRVPHGELTKVRRNAGLIVRACQRIKDGQTFEVADRVDLGAEVPANLELVEARNENRAIELLKEKLGAATLFHPVWQTQVIVARNAKGEVSRKKLNELLQPMLNADGYEIAENPFKVNDKIICTRNSKMQVVVPIGEFHEVYEAEMAREAGNYILAKDEDDEAIEAYVANGEIGRVVAIAPKLTIARFSEGDSLVKIPMGPQRDDDAEGEAEEESGGKGCNFDLAYAVTAHKLQGSEAPCVIVMGDEGASSLCSREWIYTAISRASKLCVLIGKMSVFNRMKDRRQLHKRKTFLRESILDIRYAEL